jgi:hypothetical protein
MDFKSFILATIIILNVSSQTISWEGVSNLGGGIGYSSGSQTVTPYGSSSSSSQSSFSSGNTGYSTPQSSYGVYSSQPVNFQTTSTPSYYNSYGTNSAQQMSDFLGDWVLTSIGSQRTNIPSAFTSNSFNLDYCSPLSYSYQTQSSNGISFSSGSSSSSSCGPSYSSFPSFNLLNNAFNGISNYAFAGDNLNFRNSQGNVLATLSRPVAIASAGGVTAIAAAPLPISTNSYVPTSSTGIIGSYLGSSNIGTSSSNSINIASPLVGNYRAISVNGQPVNFDVTIDGSQIRYRYCNTKGMRYTTTGSVLRISPGVSTLASCSNQYPT